MANNVSAGTSWELRPDGAELNGGGYDPFYGGTDYSQQATAQLSITDLAHTSGTLVYTSASGGFTSAMVGNVLNFFDGSGYFPTTITAFTNTHTVTCFRDYGGTFSGFSAHVGGAMTIGTKGFDPLGMLATFNVMDGVKMWVRGTNSDGSAGSYANSVQTNFNFGGTQNTPFTIEGYSTTRGDGGMFTFAMNGSNYLVMSANYSILRNIHIVGANGWECGIQVTGGACVIDNIIIEPNANSAAADFVDISGADITLRRVYIKTSTKDVYAVSVAGVRCVMEHCDFGSVGASINGHAVNLLQSAEFYHCIFRDCSGCGVYTQGGSCGGHFHQCTFWNNTLDNVRITSSSQGLINHLFDDCIFGKAGGYDISYTPSDLSANAQALEWARADLHGNWFFTTGTARYHWAPAGIDDSVLGSDPFVNAAGGNFALNPSSVGGTQVIANPRAVVMPDGSTSYITAGAVQPSLYQSPIVVASAVAGVAPSIDEVQFPTGISEGATGGASFSTVVIVAGNGLEQRVPIYTHGRYSWNAGTGLKSPADMALVTAFWLARQGRARGFRWKDWDDYQVASQTLTPDGTPTIQLFKSYVSGLVTYNRVIYKPVAGTVAITRGGTPYGSWTVDTTTGIVSWTAIIQKSITAITVASSAVVTVGTGHGFANGDVVYFTGVLGMTQINGLTGTVTANTSTTITVNINSSGFTAYTSAGTASKYPQPTDTITWSGQFDVPVRFDTDMMVMTQDSSQIRHWDSLPVVELTGG